MILQPFHVVSRGTRYRFVDAASLSSQAERDLIFAVTTSVMALMQQDAMCAALGCEERGAIDNFSFGVYDNGSLAGVFFVASMEYRSGPWVDTIDWAVVDSEAPARFYARVMPGFPPLSLDEALDLSTDTAYHFLARTMKTIDGFDVRFDRLSWAIFKDRTDANSRAAKRLHDHADADGRFRMIEVVDPSEVARTLVDIELA